MRLNTVDKYLIPTPTQAKAPGRQTFVGDMSLAQEEEALKETVKAAVVNLTTKTLEAANTVWEFEDAKKAQEIDNRLSRDIQEKMKRLTSDEALARNQNGEYKYNDFAKEIDDALNTYADEYNKLTHPGVKNKALSAFEARKAGIEAQKTIVVEEFAKKTLVWEKTKDLLYKIDAADDYGLIEADMSNTLSDLQGLMPADKFESYANEVSARAATKTKEYKDVLNTFAYEGLDAAMDKVSKWVVPDYRGLQKNPEVVNLVRQNLQKDIQARTKPIFNNIEQSIRLLAKQPGQPTTGEVYTLRNIILSSKHLMETQKNDLLAMLPEPGSVKDLSASEKKEMVIGELTVLAGLVGAYYTTFQKTPDVVALKNMQSDEVPIQKLLDNATERYMEVMGFDKNRKSEAQAELLNELGKYVKNKLAIEAKESAVEAKIAAITSWDVEDMANKEPGLLDLAKGTFFINMFEKATSNGTVDFGKLDPSLVDIDKKVFTTLKQVYKKIKENGGFSSVSVSALNGGFLGFFRGLYNKEEIGKMASSIVPDIASSEAKGAASVINTNASVLTASFIAGLPELGFDKKYIEGLATKINEASAKKKDIISKYFNASTDANSKTIYMPVSVMSLGEGFAGYMGIRLPSDAGGVTVPIKITYKPDPATGEIKDYDIDIVEDKTILDSVKTFLRNRTTDLAKEKAINNADSLGKLKTMLLREWVNSLYNEEMGE